MINKELINQEFLLQEIAILEKGYIQSVIEIIKAPIFTELNEKDLKEAKGKEEKKNIKANIDMIKISLDGHKGNLANTEKFITEAKKLITKS